MYGKFNEANERVNRLDEEGVAEQQLQQEVREGAPPQKSLGERLRGWFGGRKDQPADDDDGDTR
jgi:hypothetical protein